MSEHGFHLREAPAVCAPPMGCAHALLEVVAHALASAGGGQARTCGRNLRTHA